MELALLARSLDIARLRFSESPASLELSAARLRLSVGVGCVLFRIFGLQRGERFIEKLVQLHVMLRRVGFELGRKSDDTLKFSGVGFVSSGRLP